LLFLAGSEVDLLALLFVRGLPAVAFHGEIGRREVLALGLLRATSLPFLIAATAIGRERACSTTALARRRRPDRHRAGARAAGPRVS